jgi:hypothetical protein
VHNVGYWTTLRPSSISVYEVALGVKIRQLRHWAWVVLPFAFPTAAFPFLVSSVLRTHHYFSPL